MYVVNEQLYIRMSIVRERERTYTVCVLAFISGRSDQGLHTYASTDNCKQYTYEVHTCTDTHTRLAASLTSYFVVINPWRSLGSGPRTCAHNYMWKRQRMCVTYAPTSFLRSGYLLFRLALCLCVCVCRDDGRSTNCCCQFFADAWLREFINTISYKNTHFITLYAKITRHRRANAKQTHARTHARMCVCGQPTAMC